MFFAVFLQITPKPKDATTFSRRPQGPLIYLGLSSLTVTPSQIRRNFAIPVQIPLDRFHWQIYSPRAASCDCGIVYLKWIWATPKFASSIWQNRWKCFILVVGHISTSIFLSIYLSFCLSINLSICLSIHPVHPVHPVYPIYPVFLYLSVFLSIYRLSIYRSIDLSIYLSNPILSNLI